MKINKLQTTRMISTSIKNDINMKSEIDLLNSLPKCEQENLLPYPYKSSTATIYGITFTVQSDGGIKLYGTSTLDIKFSLAEGLVLQNGDYVLSGNKTDYYKNGVILQVSTISERIVNDIGKGGIFKYNYNPLYIYILIEENSNVDCTIYPMLERGTTPHEYRRYNAGDNDYNNLLDSLPNILYGIDSPTPSIGKDGDIYVKTGNYGLDYNVLFEFINNKIDKSTYDQDMENKVDYSIYNIDKVTLNNTINEKLSKSSLKTAIIEASAKSVETQVLGNSVGYYASINIDYSSIKGTILFTSICEVGDDDTINNNTLCKFCIISSIVRDGDKITKVGVICHKVQINIRVSIRVLYISEEV